MLKSFLLFFNGKWIREKVCRTRLWVSGGKRTKEKSFFKKNVAKYIGYKEKNKKEIDKLSKNQHMEMPFYFWNLHTASLHLRVIRSSRSWNHSGFEKCKAEAALEWPLFQGTLDTSRSVGERARAGAGPALQKGCASPCLRRERSKGRPPGSRQPQMKIRPFTLQCAYYGFSSNVILEAPWVQKYDNALSAKSNCGGSFYFHKFHREYCRSFGFIIANSKHNKYASGSRLIYYHFKQYDIFSFS